MKFIDLSVVLNEQTPFYPGDPATKIVPNGVMDKDGYEDSFISVGTHVGTHIDAPRHMLKGGKTLDVFGPENFVGRGVLINSGKTLNLDSLRGAAIEEGDIVLFNTGMSKVYFTQEYYDNYPVISEDMANFLVEKKVKMVGVDMCSVDHEPFKVHKILLGKDILIIENLNTNLESLVNKSFKVYAFPLNLQIDGSPARVVAEITE